MRAWARRRALNAPPARRTRWIRPRTAAFSVAARGIVAATGDRTPARAGTTAPRSSRAQGCGAFTMHRIGLPSTATLALCTISGCST